MLVIRSAYRFLYSKVVIVFSPPGRWMNADLFICLLWFWELNLGPCVYWTSILSLPTLIFTLPHLFICLLIGVILASTLPPSPIPIPFKLLRGEWVFYSLEGIPLTKDLLHPSHKSRRGNRENPWCRAPAPALWMWNAQDAVKSPRLSAKDKL